MTNNGLFFSISKALKILLRNRDVSAFQSRRFSGVTSGMQGAPPPKLARDFQVPSRVMSQLVTGTSCLEYRSEPTGAI